MIAKLTNNRKWLNQAMTDVVRYRIKNTGNRKPQLVTTDFDVIEDMLVKDWRVKYSFGIRYKHLLVNHKDQEVEDEDVDRILQVQSSDQEGESVSADQEVPGTSDSDSDDYITQQHGGGVSYGYQVMRRYHQPSPSVARSKKNKKQVIKDESLMGLLPPPPDMYSDYHGRPSTDQWGRPMVTPLQGFGDHGGYGRSYSDYKGYSGYPPYSQPQFSVHDRQVSQQPLHQPRQNDTYLRPPQTPQILILIAEQACTCLLSHS
jgi:hypothetical protein